MTLRNLAAEVGLWETLSRTLRFFSCGILLRFGDIARKMRLIDESDQSSDRQPATRLRLRKRLVFGIV